jgi:Flp pilus assembly protein TadG
MRTAPLSRQRLESPRGAALVELAASILVLMMVVVFTADFARVYHHVIDLENAARAGAQYGIANTADQAGMISAATGRLARHSPHRHRRDELHLRVQ